MQYTYTKEYYSTLDKKKTVKYVPKQMNLKAIILSELSQLQKDKCLLDLTYIRFLKQSNSQNERKRRQLPRARGEGDGQY